MNTSRTFMATFMVLTGAIFYAQAALSEPKESINTGTWTFTGRGTVNTHWIETPEHSLIVIDTQRDLIHAAQAVNAVRALGKPVKAILITHAHPDHYVGISSFKKAFPDAVVYSSKATRDAIRDDKYGYNIVAQKEAPGKTPPTFLAPDKTFEDNATLMIDGLKIITRELNPGEAHNTTVYYLPLSGDLYAGDAIVNGVHSPLLEGATGSWLSNLDLLDVMFPNVRTIHPGHGTSGPKQPMFENERVYLVTSREIVSQEITRTNNIETAKTSAIRRINKRFNYINPTGNPDIIKANVDALFREFSTHPTHPVG